MTSLTPHRDAVERMAAEGRAQIAERFPVGTRDRALADLSSALQDTVLFWLADAVDTRADPDETFNAIAQAWASTVVATAHNFPAEDGNPVPRVIDICARVARAITWTLHREPEVTTTVEVEQTGNA